MNFSEQDELFMRRALELAARGEGFVEPNPMVGCVLAKHDAAVGEGWHRQFGGPHAEIEALRTAGPLAQGATAYVTLEPCCHQGKTPPCAQALIAAGVSRVVAAVEDPFPSVAGQGLAQLRQAGLQVETGLLAEEARWLLAPFLMRVVEHRPWVIAKWAMSLDGKIATAAGHSQWISSPQSRAVAHKLRRRVDAIAVGVGTALADNPLLTARPAGARKLLRIVFDSRLRLPLESQLVRTAREVPLLVIGDERQASPQARDSLQSLGGEVLLLSGDTRATRLKQALDALAQRDVTNLLVEGGGQLLGEFDDARFIDEAHVFIAPRFIGGHEGLTPLAGRGVAKVPDGSMLSDAQWKQCGSDLYVHGRVTRSR